MKKQQLSSSDLLKAVTEVLMKLREEAKQTQGSTHSGLLTPWNPGMKRNIRMKRWLIKTKDGRKQCRNVFKVLNHDVNISKKPNFRNGKPKEKNQRQHQLREFVTNRPIIPEILMFRQLKQINSESLNSYIKWGALVKNIIQL